MSELIGELEMKEKIIIKGETLTLLNCKNMLSVRKFIIQSGGVLNFYNVKEEDYITIIVEAGGILNSDYLRPKITIFNSGTWNCTGFCNIDKAIQGISSTYCNDLKSGVIASSFHSRYFEDDE